jgi:hypothetical protein
MGLDSYAFYLNNRHLSAPVAQLDRVSGYELEGRRFESFRVRHFIYIALVAQLDRVSGFEPEGRRFESFRARH